MEYLFYKAVLVGFNNSSYVDKLFNVLQACLIN